MLRRWIVVPLSVVSLVSAACAAPPRDVVAPRLHALRLPAADGALPELCHQPVRSLDAARAILDTMSRMLTESGTPPGPHRAVALPPSASPRLASFAMRADTAIISAGSPLGGHSLYHELLHAWAARLSPAEARALIDYVFATDQGAGWPPEVARWAVASYLSVIGGLGDPAARGFTEMALTVTASALDTASAGRLTRVFDATGGIVDRTRGLGGPHRTIGAALEHVARAHWRYAGHPVPRGWDAAMERRFILASELVAYARERSCLLGHSLTKP